MHRGELTGNFSGLRHVAALVSAVMWVLYGLPPLVNQNAGVIVTSNAIGSVIQIFYLTVFVIYAQRDKRRNVVFLLAAFFPFVFFVGMITVMDVGENVRRYLAGGNCLFFGIVACAWPLCRMITAVRTGSWQSLPIGEYWLLVINGIIWSWYGFLIYDGFVKVSNLLGLGFGLILVLSRCYPNRHGGAEEGIVVNSSSLDNLDREPIKGARNSQPPSSPPRALQSN